MLERVDPLYCGACGMPPEFCEYGPDFETHCLPWLKKKHPALYADLHSNRKETTDGGEEDAAAPTKPERPSDPWTMEERLTAFYEKYEPGKVDNVPSLLEKYAGKEDKLFTALTKKYGDEPEDPYYAESDDEDYDDDDDDDDLAQDAEGLNITGDSTTKKRRGVGAKKAQKVVTRVVIQKIVRNKRKATTVVVGMETVPGIKLKDVSKAFSKRFAGSSSVKDGIRGKEIIIQGDHMDAVAEMCVEQFAVPGDSVFLDVNGEFVPFS